MYDLRLTSVIQTQNIDSYSQVINERHKRKYDVWHILIQYILVIVCIYNDIFDGNIELVAEMDVHVKGSLDVNLTIIWRMRHVQYHLYSKTKSIYSQSLVTKRDTHIPCLQPMIDFCRNGQGKLGPNRGHMTTRSWKHPRFRRNATISVLETFSRASIASWSSSEETTTLWMVLVIRSFLSL